MKPRGVYMCFHLFFIFFTLTWLNMNAGCLFLTQYLSGFGNELSSEDPRCPGALPEGQVTHKKKKKKKHTHTVVILAFVHTNIYSLILFSCLTLYSKTHKNVSSYWGANQ